MKTMQIFLFCIFSLLLARSAVADILILQYGDLATGKVVETNNDYVVLQQKMGTIRYATNMIKDIMIEDDGIYQ